MGLLQRGSGVRPSLNFLKNGSWYSEKGENLGLGSMWNMHGYTGHRAC